MPPKFRFKKEEIIYTAIEITKTNGAEALTARSLAGSLGASPKVIFGSFKDMNEVKNCVFELSLQFCKSETDSNFDSACPIQSVCRAYVNFAVSQPNLFNLLFVNNTEENLKKAFLEAFNYKFEKAVGLMAKNYGMSNFSAATLYTDMWVYAHGLASLIAANVCKFDGDQTLRMITDCYNGMLANYLKSNRPEEMQNNMQKQQ